MSTIGGLRSTQRAEGDANVAKNSHLLAPRAGACGHHAATASANQNDNQTFNFAESQRVSSQPSLRARRKIFTQYDMNAALLCSECITI